MKMRNLLSVLAIASAAMAVPAIALAQAYPNKPIRIVMPYPAGSASDTYLRALVEQAKSELGQPIIIEPRPGAGTAIATQYVIGQPADGYTLLYTSSAMSIKSAVAKAPFDIRKDLTHIAGILSGTTLFAVNAQLPVKTVGELVAHAKANPGKLNFGSYGPNTLGHLMAELFQIRTGTKMVHIPYSGSTNNVLALSQGESHATFDVFITMRPHLEAQKIRMLAVSTAARDPDYPELPGMAEAGIADFDVPTWQGLAGPAGLPREVVEKVNAAFAAALKTPEAADFKKRTRVPFKHTSPEAMTTLVNREVATWKDLIEKAKLDIE
jgi:tripartite-type tricarboxylate transporter receptor subunit TctC